jgi:hypothetical protein
MKTIRSFTTIALFLGMTLLFGKPAVPGIQKDGPFKATAKITHEGGPTYRAWSTADSTNAAEYGYFMCSASINGHNAIPEAKYFHGQAGGGSSIRRNASRSKCYSYSDIYGTGTDGEYYAASASGNDEDN